MPSTGAADKSAMWTKLQRRLTTHGVFDSEYELLGPWTGRNSRGRGDRLLLLVNSGLAVIYMVLAALGAVMYASRQHEQGLIYCK